jgi:hypothetical protein
MTLDEFEKQVISACAASLAVIGVSIFGIGITWIRLRAYLVDGSVLDAFYNEVTRKTAFAVIKREQRIFGADNTGGNWHWHPFGAPESHISAKESIDFPAFLSKIEEHLI